MKTFATIAFILLQLCVQAQDKEEREWRIKSKQVPSAALQWFKDAYDSPKKLKWFAETNESGSFYEAKLKWKGKLHSAKFSEQGSILDIEIVMELSEVPESARTSISAVLDSISKGYRILKLQEQWTGNPEDLEDLIDEQKTMGLQRHYELEVFFREGRQAGHRELLFSELGALKSIRGIKTNTTDHLHF